MNGDLFIFKDHPTNVKLMFDPLMMIIVNN